MYGDQFGEFECGYQDLKGLIMMALITMMAITQSSLFHDRHHYKLRYKSP